MKVDSGAGWRVGLYGLALVYLFLDLFVFHGPLRKKIRGADLASAQAIAEEMERGVAARVYFQPILLTQIDRAVEERLWREGKGVEGLSSDRLKELRLAAINRLFDEHLLRIKVRFNPERAAVENVELARAVRWFQKRFVTEQEFEEAMAMQGWRGMEELGARVGAKLEQEAYLEELVGIEVSEEEAKNFYDENRNQFRRGERIRCRQIFFASLDHGEAGARRLAEEALEEVKKKNDFAEVAERRSEDLKSKRFGGDLGWMEEGRGDEEFFAQVAELVMGQMEVVETRLGSHVVEVLEREEGGEMNFKGVKEELRVALSNRKREEGLRDYRDILRRRERGKLEIFEEVLEKEWSLK
ncbi:MAG: peptidylprolyl isomerase [Verrucomicrobiota bacterium]